jgi:tetratricopeptide (TPR) repeat protein
MRSLSLLVIVMVTFVMTARPARAQQEGADEGRARDLFREGSELYERAHYDEAIERFEEAYRLSLRPGLLFNIAQAYRLKGPSFCDTALRYYERDLDGEPEASNRAEIEDLARQMRLCAAAALAPAPPAPVAPPVMVQAPPVAPAPSRWPVWGAVAGGTVALLGAGAYAASWAKFSSVRGRAPYPPGTFRGWQTITSASYAIMAAGAALTAASLVVLATRHGSVTVGPATVTMSATF